MISLQFVELLIDLVAVRRSAIALLVAGTFMPLVGVLIIGLDVVTVRFAVMHMALLGSAIGTWVGLDPLLCAVLVCAMTGVIIGPAAESKGGLAAPMSMLMTLSAAAALLVLSISGVNANGAFEILWGSILAVRRQDILMVFVAAILVSVVFMRSRRDISLLLYDREVAASSGVNVVGLTTLLLVVIAVSVGTSIRVTGALLVDSITVLPAIAAREIGRDLRSVSQWAMAIGATGSVCGFIIALQLDLPPGPVLVLVSGSIAMSAGFFARRTRSQARRRPLAHMEH